MACVSSMERPVIGMGNRKMKMAIDDQLCARVGENERIERFLRGFF